jgi:hypothetical protein
MAVFRLGTHRFVRVPFCRVVLQSKCVIVRIVEFLVSQHMDAMQLTVHLSDKGIW